MHFCLPAQLMKLIEMSPGIRTSDETFQRAWVWTESCNQIPVKTQDKPGLILNALLVPFNDDAVRAVEAGVANAADIDRAIRSGPGYRMGPFELLDLIGLDTQIRLSEAFYPITLDPRAAAAAADGCLRPAGSKIGTRILRLSRQRDVWSLIMRYAIIKQGESPSFPANDPFLAQTSSEADAEVMIYCGVDHNDDESKQAILIELGNECLGEHTGESSGTEGSNVVGFARYRKGSGAR